MMGGLVAGAAAPNMMAEKRRYKADPTARALNAVGERASCGLNLRVMSPTFGYGEIAEDGVAQDQRIQNGL
jgi:hypothetical protein